MRALKLSTHRNRLLLFVVCSVGLGFATRAWSQTALDKSLAPPDDGDEVSNVFRDMGVVQRKAMIKGGKFLISNYGSLDFSDGPYSMYGFNVNPGYAISDFWEIYVNTTPFFITSPRSIVGKVNKLDIFNPDDPTTPRKAVIGSVRPKFLAGGELLWAPAYGKDSIGSRRVIRSDTFFKLGVSQIFYEGGDKGLKFHLGVGKTYFLTRWMGFRLTASANYLQSIIESGSADATTGVSSLTRQKSFGFFAIVEAGFVFYL